jgi:hypothetical protein
VQRRLHHNFVSWQLGRELALVNSSLVQQRVGQETHRKLQPLPVLHEAEGLVLHLQPEVRLVSHGEEPWIVVADHDRNLFPHVRQSLCFTSGQNHSLNEILYTQHRPIAAVLDVAGPYPRVPSLSSSMRSERRRTPSAAVR